MRFPWRCRSSQQPGAAHQTSLLTSSGSASAQVLVRYARQSPSSTSQTGYIVFYCILLTAFHRGPAESCPSDCSHRLKFSVCGWWVNHNLALIVCHCGFPSSDWVWWKTTHLHLWPAIWIWPNWTARSVDRAVRMHGCTLEFFEGDSMSFANNRLCQARICCRRQKRFCQLHLHVSYCVIGFLAWDITVKTKKGGLGSSFPRMMISRGMLSLCFLFNYDYWGQPAPQFNGSAPLKFRNSRRPIKVRTVSTSILGSMGLILDTKVVPDDRVVHTATMMQGMVRTLLTHGRPPIKAVAVDDPKKYRRM